MSKSGTRHYRRIVVKVGTNLLTAGTERLDLEAMAALVGQVARLHRQGRELIVVTSGAVAAGRQRLGGSPSAGGRGTAQRQVLAAIGQSRLMHTYEELFEWHGIAVAQALLTRRDLADRQGYLNARNTLESLLALKVVPIANENDVVAVDELAGAVFGDNDNLSAMVANLVDADLLVLLTDTGGLYTADPHLNPQAKLIPRVERIDAELEALAGGAGERGVGGMATKVQAARLATASGVAVVIANGREPKVLERLAAGEALGTFFVPSPSVESRHRWLLAGLAARGSIVVDGGAVKALKEGKRSLLPAGVRGVEGEFERGDMVNIVDGQGRAVGCGIANYPARDLARIVGLASSKISAALGYDYGAEVVHRNNLAVL